MNLRTDKPFHRDLKGGGIGGDGRRGGDGKRSEGRGEDGKNREKLDVKEEGSKDSGGSGDFGKS